MTDTITPPQRLGFAEALQQLKAAQKPSSGVPAYTLWVNRPAGRVLAAAAQSIGMTPNQVTVASGAVSLLGIGLLVLAPVSPAWMALAVFLLLLAYALDSADGQVARLTGVSSKAGEWLDHVVDAARLPALHMGIAAALFRSVVPDQRGVVILPLLFALLASTWFFAQILAAQMGSRGDMDTGPRGPAPAWVSFAKLPSDIGTTYLLLLLLPWPMMFVPLYFGLFGFSVVQAALALRRRFRELSAAR